MSGARGIQAMWHVNQAVSLAAEALRDATNNDEGDMMSPDELRQAKAAWDALQKLVPVILSGTGRTQIEVIADE